jgi:hypothetical protein
MTLHTYKALHQRCISIEVNIGENQYCLWCQPKRKKNSPETTLDGVSLFLLRSRGSIWERCPNWDGWLDDPAETRGLIPCIPCMWCWAQSARPSLYSNIFCALPRRHVGLTLTFQANPVSGCIQDIGNIFWKVLIVFTFWCKILQSFSAFLSNKCLLPLYILHFHTAVIKTTNGRSLGSLKTLCFLSRNKHL